MPFSPKFIDLVRSHATVLGVGPVTPGAAVSGFTGVAQALKTGDQFYYCLQNADKPAEREVGRGTVMADGVIARDAIGGVPTEFSGGAKTIALVTAAEWYERVETSASGAATRDELTSGAADGDVRFLSEAGREGLFVFRAEDLSAEVSTDPMQGLFVAPAEAPDGKEGAWVRHHSGGVDVRWFGARADGISDDGPAFAAALATLQAGGLQDYSDYHKGSRRLLVPSGDYYLGTTTLDIFHTLAIEGDGSGLSGGAPSRLIFAPGTTGIRVQRYNTSQATGVDALEHLGGDGCIVRGLNLIGGYIQGQPEGPFHGIHLKARAIIENVVVNGFQGDGIHIAASSGAGGAMEGNANCFSIARVGCLYNQNGLWIAGADANAGSIVHLDCSFNRQWGVWDNSFLGNSYLACHADGNGITLVGLPLTMASHGGRRYSVRPGEEEWASVNPPSGTEADNRGWTHVSEGGAYRTTIPIWSSGMPLRSGGAYRTDGINAANVFIGCYSESGQGPSRFVSPTLVLSGLHGAGTVNYAGMLDSDGGLRTAGDLKVGRNLTLTGNATLADLSARDAAISGNLRVTGSVNVDGSNISLGPKAGTAADIEVYVESTNYYNSLVFRTWSQGVPSNDSRLTSVRGGIFIADTGIEHRLRLAGTDVVKVDAGGLTMVRPGMGIGYGAGAGGSVVQATSKATAVTLNRAAGQVQLHAASLAAGASVSFTMSNSAIAAGDVVVASIGTGASANAYQLIVDQVAAGSCRVQLRNQSAGALAEAVTINFALIKAAAA